MTDKEEREERILRLTEEEFLVYRDGAWDEYGSKILLKIMSRNWFDLELAPKHTDEEYDEVWARLNSCQLEWARLKLRNALSQMTFSRREGDR